MDRVTVQQNTFLLIADHTGDWYAIPQATVEQFKLSAEEKALAAEHLEHDVEGYGMYNHMINANRADYHQAELQRDGARERMLHDQSKVDVRDEAAQAPSGRGVLTAIFTNLAFLKPRTTGPG